MATVGDVYGERNLAAQLAAVLAAEAGYPVWCRDDPVYPHWPIIYITLPARGQVSFHVPPRELLAALPESGPAWDGHSRRERLERLRAFLYDRRRGGRSGEGGRR